jgi:hypothetical protein
MNFYKLALGLTLPFCILACKTQKGTPVPPAPEPTITTSSVSAYSVVRRGARPVFERGRLRIFVNPGAMDLDMGLPGIALGDAKGPRYGLLGGYFSPRIIAPDTSKNYRVVAETSKSGLRVQFFDGDRPVIDARFGVQGERPQVNLHGDALLTMPADRVQILGETGGAPAFARGLAAGDEPQFDLRHADRLQVSSEKHGAFLVLSDCHNFRIIQPVLRGSTSVFVLQLGASAPPTDHLYAPPLPDNPPQMKNCAGTVSSTLSVP